MQKGNLIFSGQKNRKEIFVAFSISVFSSSDKNTQLLKERRRNRHLGDEKTKDSTNRRNSRFSGFTHPFGVFFSNFDTYLMPWSENCWLSVMLNRDRKDTWSANVAKARERK